MPEEFMPEEFQDKQKGLVIPEPQHEAALDIISRALFGNKFSSKKSKLYANAFHLKESDIKELNDRAVDQIRQQRLMDGTDVVFSGTVRFADNSSQDFDDLDRMLKRAADLTDPESITLSWRALVAGYGPLLSGIEANFITEKNLKTGTAGAFDFAVAYMSLDVYAAEQNWVEGTFSQLTGIFSSAKLPWPYAPLFIFRSKVVVQVFAQAIAWGSFFAVTNKIAQLFREAAPTPPSAVLKSILEANSISDKFDLYAGYILRANEPWWNAVVTLGGGMVVYLSILFVALLLLPLLAPRSRILIGLYKARLEFWANVTRFLILTVAISGFAIPIIRAVPIIKGLF